MFIYFSAKQLIMEASCLGVVSVVFENVFRTHPGIMGVWPSIAQPVFRPASCIAYIAFWTSSPPVDNEFLYGRKCFRADSQQ